MATPHNTAPEIYRRHWVRIVGRPTYTERAVTLAWDYLPYEVITKWRWYFKYRAALLQVQNPRWIIEHTWGITELEAPEVEHLQRTKGQVTGKRANVTKWTNAAVVFEAETAQLRASWTQLFPIEESPAFIERMRLYNLSMIKLEKIKADLKQTEERYNAMLEAYNKSKGKQL